MPHKPFKYSRAVFKKAVSIWNKAKNEWLSREPRLSEKPAACIWRPHTDFPSAVPAGLRLPRWKTAGATPVWRTNVNAEVSSEDIPIVPEAESELLELPDHAYADKEVQTHGNTPRASPPQSFTEQPPAETFGHVSMPCESLNHVEHLLPTPDCTVDSHPSPRRCGLDLQPQTVDDPYASEILPSRAPSRRLSLDSQLSRQSCLETPTSSFYAGGWYQYAFGNISRRSLDSESPNIVLDKHPHELELCERSEADDDDCSDDCVNVDIGDTGSD